MIEFVKGNIFDCGCEAIVNCVNCVGIAGKGLALKFREYYPDAYIKYKRVCEQGLLLPGHTVIWKHPLPYGYDIISLATKNHWRNKSQYQWIEYGLQSLDYTMKLNNIKSIGIPALGCGEGGLDYKIVKEMIKKYHDEYWNDIKVMVYEPLK